MLVCSLHLQRTRFTCLPVVFAFLCTGLLSHEANAIDPAEAATAWFDKVLSGEVVLTAQPSGTDASEAPHLELSTNSQEAASEFAVTLWQAYRDAATTQGWQQQIPQPSRVGRTTSSGQSAPSTPPTQSIDIIEMESSDGQRMPCCLLQKGDKPPNGWPLFICMHGGGKYFGKEKLTDPHGWMVNSREFTTQIALARKVYQPDGMYFVPRMADDNRGRWFHQHNLELFQRLIRGCILFYDVDPNRVYITGISQGGYGTGHLAPLLADRFAAASPMAGGAEVVYENLRNLPFRSEIGEHDTMYRRIELAQKTHEKLEELHQSDPGGYSHLLSIQKGKGHGIDYSPVPNWLSEHTRNPYPQRVVWRCHEKDGFYNPHFYWLSVTEVPSSGYYHIIAEIDRETQTIEINAHQNPGGKAEEGDITANQPLSSTDLVVHLNDQLLDLDEPFVIKVNGQVQFSGIRARTPSTMARNLAIRGDLNYAFPVDIVLKLHETPQAEPAH
ncbi:hypothetical protein [Aureliella helgolandensis]|uniref:Alpha/beta hydrolase family protein n=1 Tax=Aureliella helgolandensis TaxID=2527968 RepID=A0A518G043_9BACT|nr:hypothetical protein [Aureliella helgolandensis]QDV21910.1 hypothetical protein Q31a_01890 [Aureliella helgolandensis]